MTGLDSRSLVLSPVYAWSRGFRGGKAVWDGIGHAGAVLSGLDGRTVSFGVAAVVLAVVLGALAGIWAGAWAGVAGSLAGLVPPAVLAVAVERRQRVRTREMERREVLRKFAPPSPMGDEEEGQ